MVGGQPRAGDRLARMDADALVVGAGLAGLVAANELADAGRSVVLLDQESEANLGGQAWWSFGGLFLVDSPEQRRMGIKDNFDLAWQDWEGSAGWDRDEDYWPRKWGRAYVEWAAGEKRDGCGSSASASSPSSAGPSAAMVARAATATRCRASTSRGGRAPVSSRPSSSASGPTSPAVASSIARATASTRSSRPAAPSPECVDPFSQRTIRRAAWPPTVTSSATSSSARTPSSSPVAASAATTTSCAPTGPTASAPRRST